MTTEGDTLTPCGHTMDRVCDHCPEEVRQRHMHFWKGFDK